MSSNLQHKPNDDRISIATESYGGRYGPAFAAYFQEQNEKIVNGTFTEMGQTHLLHLDTLLIINGCIDRYVQWPAYPKMMYNNTYGIKAVNESRYEGVIDDLYREGGCLDQIEQCRNISLVYDPTNQGYNETVNKVCADAETFCSENIRDPYFDTDLNYYDISVPGAASFPPPWYIGWLNQPHVQQGLGVPLNWTQSNSAVSRAFRNIGDYPRPGWKEDLAYLLEEGVKITLLFGDRDYACNWYGGELLSLAIPYANATSFAAAGYADVVVNDTYIGGQTRQYGNLSFTRVYEAGHEVSTTSISSEMAHTILTLSRSPPTSPKPPTKSSNALSSTTTSQPAKSPPHKIPPTPPKDQAMYQVSQTSPYATQARNATSLIQASARQSSSTRCWTALH